MAAVTSSDASVITIHQGGMHVWTKKLPPSADQAALLGGKMDEDAQYQGDQACAINNHTHDPAETQQDTPFMFLALDLPPPPLFQDEMEANIIPQVPLSELLAKFNGINTKACDVALLCDWRDGRTGVQDVQGHAHEAVPAEQAAALYAGAHQALHQEHLLPREEPHHRQLPHQVCSMCMPLPQYPTHIIAHRNIDVRPYLDINSPDFDKPCKYDLLANIVHDGLPGAGKGTYRMYFFHKVRPYGLCDLHA